MGSFAKGNSYSRTSTSEKYDCQSNRQRLDLPGLMLVRIEVLALLNFWPIMGLSQFDKDLVLFMAAGRRGSVEISLRFEWLSV